jgi:excisionase family DNA binding protein
MTAPLHGDSGPFSSPEITRLVAAIEEAVSAATPLMLSTLLAELERLKAVAWARVLRAAWSSSQEMRSSEPLEDLVHLTPAQVAERLNLKEPYIHELCRTRRIPAIKHGKYWLIPVEGLRGWLATERDASQRGREERRRLDKATGTLLASGFARADGRPSARAQARRSR